jgi:hypothetical protein
MGIAASVRASALALGLASIVVAGCPKAAPPRLPTTDGSASASATGASPAPNAASAPPGTPGDPFAVTGAVGQEALPPAAPELALKKLAFPRLGAGVPAAPKACDAFSKRKAAGKLRCSDRPSALDALTQALAEADRAERDALLLDLERCAELPVGLVRALRADLGPTECADVLVEPLLSAIPKGITGAVHDALFGIGLAGRLARTVSDPPKLAAPFDKQRVKEFHEGSLRTWGLSNAKAIEELAKLGAGLAYYGKAVAAVEAGMADMRFVVVVREVPVPDDFRADRELLETYYASLERALEPRKDRGRDAALVGLRGCALVGVISDARVKRARQLLSQVYGGRPIDALDALLLPAAPEPEAGSREERLAALLPTFYAGLLLEPAVATQARVLAQLARRGIPLPQRIALRAAELTPELRQILGRARLDFGRSYWRAADFDEAVAVLSSWPQSTPRPADASFLLALGLGLRGGPVDAAAMIRKAPLEALGIGNTAALDALGSAPGANELAGQAELDAALIRQLAASPAAGVEVWRDLAQRYGRALGKLTDPNARAVAAEHLEEVQATVKAIEARSAQPTP